MARMPRNSNPKGHDFTGEREATMFKKGHAPTKIRGHLKGCKDGATLIRWALRALDMVGGVEYLVKCAKKDPKSFLQFISKTMPKDVRITAEVSFTDRLKQMATKMKELEREAKSIAEGTAQGKAKAEVPAKA